MDIRKLQVTGGSSYIVTLPKDWVLANDLKKNDSIAINPVGGRALMISPHTGGDSPLKKKMVITLSQDKTPRMLKRLLISAYLMGHTHVEVESKKRIGTKHREAVSSFVQKAIGPEVIEETDTQIVIKDILNPTDIDVKNSMRRLKTLVRTMHLDAAEALIKKDERLAQDVVARDTDVDRLNWLISHQYNIFRADPARAAEMGFTPDEGHFNFLTSWVAERIGDHAKRIARNVKPLFGDRRPTEKLAEAGRLVADVYADAMESHLSSNIDLANRTIDAASEVGPIAENIIRSALKRDTPKAYPLLRIADSIKRSGEYSIHISEFVLDRLIDRV